MRIVCISDTHNGHNSLNGKLPDGDILIHAGDSTSRGIMRDITSFGDWFAKQPHKNKVVIAGNHDFCFENENKDLAQATIKNAHYLLDSGVEIGGLKIWGTPWQPWFFDWAFNIKLESDRKAKWDLIPSDTDILVVHGPPFGHGDLCASGDRPGCKALKEKILNSNIKLVVTGHIHEDYGEYMLGNTKVVNASIMNLQYKPVNLPIVVEL